MKTAWLITANDGPSEPPKIYWSGGATKGAFVTGRAQAYDAELTIQMIPKQGRAGGYDFKLWYRHSPTAGHLAEGAQSERSLLLDEGECQGTGQWGYSAGDFVGPIWKDFGAIFIWMAARDAISPFDWPDWVKGKPEDLSFYQRWDG